MYFKENKKKEEGIAAGVKDDTITDQRAHPSPTYHATPRDQSRNLTVLISDPPRSKG